MSKYGPSSAFLLVGGRDISGDTFTLEETIENVLEEKHGLGTAWEESLPVGLARVTLDAGGGLYDDRVGGIVEALQAKGATRQLVLYGLSGKSPGAEATLLDGTYATTWKRISSRDGLTKAHAVHKLTGEYLSGRLLLAALASADPGTGISIDSAADPLSRPRVITSSSLANPTTITCPVDHGMVNGEIILITGHSGSTPSLNGGNGYAITSTGLKTFTIPVNVTGAGTGGTYQKVSSLGLTADQHISSLVLGGFTNLIVKVQHSIDSTTWVDLFTFTAATGITVERKSTLAQVNRWLKTTYDFSGTGSGQSAGINLAVARPVW